MRSMKLERDLCKVAVHREIEKEPDSKKNLREKSPRKKDLYLKSGMGEGRYIEEGL